MSSQFELDTWRVAGSGHWFIGVAGESLRNRSAVRLGVNGRSYLADADSTTTMPCMGINITATTAAGQNVSVLISGFVELPGNVWTAGAKLYVSTAPGALTHTAPTGVSDLVQEVGFAMNTTQIYFNPQLGGDELSLIDYEVQTGTVAEPTTVSRGNGHAVEVYNSTEDRTFLWLRCNADTDWMGVEVL